jgi:hypothetical protein
LVLVEWKDHLEIQPEKMEIVVEHHHLDQYQQQVVEVDGEEDKHHTHKDLVVLVVGQDTLLEQVVVTHTQVLQEQ